MINSIIKAIAVALNKEFGDDYEIYSEVNKQELKEPCFFITCLNPTVKLFLRNKYFRQNKFCIQYFPQTDDVNNECHITAERLLWCLEEISVQNDTMRGINLRYEVVDGILTFFVNYDCFVYKNSVPEKSMEEINDSQSVKG